jgi:hypothetical protein
VLGAAVHEGDNGSLSQRHRRLRARYGAISVRERVTGAPGVAMLEAQVPLAGRHGSLEEGDRGVGAARGRVRVGEVEAGSERTRMRRA